MFGWLKSKRDSSGKDAGDAAPAADPRVFSALERIEKAGAQLLVRFGQSGVYTSTLLGLGRDAFFIDTLSPPEGDDLATPGAEIMVETLADGITCRFSARILGKVEFLDDLPAFKLSYPALVFEERRRKTHRVRTHGTASISFLSPFGCDAPVLDISEGGFAFEYGAEHGRLKSGVPIGGAFLEIGTHGVLTVDVEVVITLVGGLGGLSLPSTYRTGVRFTGLSGSDRAKIRAYLQDLQSLTV